MKIDRVYRIYAFIFGRTVFRRLNQFLFNISLRGLGILNYQSSYLSGEISWLGKYLEKKTNPVIFDVGANTGEYTKDVLKVNPTSIVYAFEPHKSAYAILSQIAKNNPQIKAFNYGLGSIEKQLELFDYEDNGGSQHASLYKDVFKVLRRKSFTVSHVDILTLDNFVKENGLNVIDLLKIDVEGNELDVLIGAIKTIDSGKVKAIQFEFNEMNTISRVFFKDFCLQLKCFDLYRLLPGGQLLEINYFPHLNEIFAYQNIVAVRKF